jgi:hypothetical protein
MLCWAPVAFMPIILATWEAEIRRIMKLGQPRHIVLETVSQKYPTQGGGGRGEK